MLTEFKPCPFCGGSVELEKTLDRQYWGVVCRNSMNVGGTCAIEQRPSASKDAAIERWNRRAANEQQAASGLSDDARECLEDVVSHHEDFVSACNIRYHLDNAKGDADSAAYWERQMDVLRRMKAQAERALLAAKGDGHV